MHSTIIMALTVQDLALIKNGATLMGYIFMQNPRFNTLYSVSVRVVNTLKIGKRIERRTASRASLLQFMKVNKGHQMPPQVRLLLNRGKSLMETWVTTFLPN